MINTFSPSFRNVSFSIRSENARTGVKQASHDFINSNQRFIEPLGVMPPIFKLKAFIHGLDVISQRDKLIAALNNPTLGTLIHPYYGRVLVFPHPFDVSSEETKRGEISFDLTFKTSSSDIFPTTTGATLSKLSKEVDKSRSSIKTTFDSEYPLIGSDATQSAVETKIVSFSDSSTDLLVRTTGDSSIIADTKKLIETLSTKSSSLANSASDLSGAIGSIMSNLGSLNSDVNQFTKMASFGDQDTFIPPNTSDRKNRIKNLTLINDIIQTNSVLTMYEQSGAKSYDTNEQLSAEKDIITKDFLKVAQRAILNG